MYVPSSPLNTVLRWCVPPGFQDLLRKWRGDWEALRTPGAVLRENEQFRNCHQDRRRCFILATGPSIKTQDLRPLQGETCIGVSNFYLHPHYDVIRPEYHCVPQVSFPPATVESAVRWFSDMGSRIGRAKIFLGVGDREFVLEHKLFPGRDVHYLGFGKSWKHINVRGLDLTRPLPKIQSVPVMALQIALFMGFREIYLLGCDHDYILNYGVTRHFYDLKDHPILTPGKSEWTDFEDEVRRQGVLWSQYQALRGWAEPKGIRIVNATAGGLLSVFERVRFESLFEPAQGKEPTPA